MDKGEIGDQSRGIYIRLSNERRLPEEIPRAESLTIGINVHKLAL